MFVKAPVINAKNEKVNEKFLLTFYHTPVKKNKRRKCICKIYYCSGDKVDIAKEKYSLISDINALENEKHPETKSMVLLSSGTATCVKEDNYVKAYARMLAFQRAFRNLTNDVYFKFTNETFKSIATQMNKECSHGVAVAVKLQHTEGYIV